MLETEQSSKNRGLFKSVFLALSMILPDCGVKRLCFSIRLYLFNLAIWTILCKVVVYSKENKVPKESTDDDNIPKTIQSHGILQPVLPVE